MESWVVHIIVDSADLIQFLSFPQNTHSVEAPLAQIFRSLLQSPQNLQQVVERLLLAKQASKISKLEVGEMPKVAKKTNCKTMVINKDEEEVFLRNTAHLICLLADMFHGC